ncbi:MAG: hypothetical protein QME68_06080, partial [Elusimicrobiota bacterium]|nr:hypothetical protein [Elusimicrobiota bacterium]
MTNIYGKIISINLSDKKGTAKKPVGSKKEVVIKENFGIVGDAHSGSEREVSLLGWERIQEWLKHKTTYDLPPTTRSAREGRRGRLRSTKLVSNGFARYEIRSGDFAENITTTGIDWSKIKLGDKIKIYDQVRENKQQPRTILQVTQIGKQCHSACNIRKLVGDCLMPKEGIFAKVIKGGKIK